MDALNNIGVREYRQDMEWGDLRIFLQVARNGQMASAARELGIDHSTVSRRIARLEDDMSVSLFHRAGRRLGLTAEGSRLLHTSERLESIIIREVLRLAEDASAVAGRVRIGATEGFGAHYLAARLPRLLALHPKLEIELVAMPKSYSLAAREVDIAITIDRPQAGDIRFKKLSSYALALYGSRGYLAMHDTPLSMDTLSSHVWCGYIEELLFTPELELPLLGDHVVHPDFRSTSITAQLEAVRSGRAIAILPCYIGDRAHGIEAMLWDTLRLERTYWIAVHNDLAESTRIRAAMRAIERWVMEDRSLLLPDRRPDTQ